MTGTVVRVSGRRGIVRFESEPMSLSATVRRGGSDVGTGTLFMNGGDLVVRMDDGSRLEVGDEVVTAA